MGPPSAVTALTVRVAGLERALRTDRDGGGVRGLRHLLRAFWGRRHDLKRLFC